MTDDNRNEYRSQPPSRWWSPWPWGDWTPEQWDSWSPSKQEAMAMATHELGHLTQKMGRDDYQDRRSDYEFLIEMFTQGLAS